jgi:hypothetical protein
MEEKSWKQGRVEARFEGGQGPEGAVAPYMDGWMDGYMTTYLASWDTTGDAGNVRHHCPGRAERDASCLRKCPARHPHFLGSSTERITLYLLQALLAILLVTIVTNDKRFWLSAVD